MAEQVNMDALTAAQMCNFQPSITDVLVAEFEHYRFTLAEETMLASEVFDGSGFLPLLDAAATSLMRRLFSYEFGLEISDDLDGSILGLAANPVIDHPQSRVLYSACIINACKDIFGTAPSLIRLDDLLRWGTNSEARTHEIPKLGIDAPSISRATRAGGA